MRYNRNSNQEGNDQRPRRRFQNKPSSFPSVFVYEADGTQLEVPLASGEAWDAFIRNLRIVDPQKLRGLINLATSGGQPIAEPSLREALRHGETWREAFASDGPVRDCGICGRNFQPLVIPREGRNGGNFGTFRTADVSRLRESVDAEVAERVTASATATTREVFGSDQLPKAAVLLPVCKDCRSAFRVPYVSLTDAREACVHASDGIAAGNARRQLASVLPVGRLNRQPYDRGRDRNDRRDDQRDRRGDRRERPEFVDWHGASVLPQTAEALTAAGYASLADAIKAADSGELMAKGIAHTGSIHAIAGALKRASDSGQTVGSAAGFAGARPATASRPRPTKLTFDARGGGDKKAPPRQRRGGSGKSASSFSELGDGE